MAETVPLKTTKQNEVCPICGKSRDHNFIPFCSKHCADIDLGKWLTGDYRIPISEDEDLDGELPNAEH